MKKVNIDKLTHLGSDYKRNTDYYLDPKTGKLYKREVVLVQIKNQIDCADQTVTEMVEGDTLYDISNRPVLSRDN